MLYKLLLAGSVPCVLITPMAFAQSGACNFICGDANADLSVNIGDAVFLILYVFSGGPAPQACPSMISIINLQPGDDTVVGTASVPDTSAHKVVIRAKTDRWYVQPYIEAPFTIIQGDGAWSSYTHAFNRIVALLVDSTYVPGSVNVFHPAGEPGVVCWDEYPDDSFRDFEWSGYNWRIKDANLVVPDRIISRMTRPSFMSIKIISST